MRDDSGKCLLVITNLPDRERAMELARTVIGKRLAACVNVLNGCTSVYRWRDQVQDDAEVPVLIKTCSSRFTALQEEILATHPYELPEIIALPIDQGHEPYLAWVRAEVDVSA